MSRGRKIVVGLDVGTTKICCMVAETSGEQLEVLGVGSHPSEGLRKGMVINMDKAASSIRKALSEASMMSNCEITRVVTGVAGAHVRSFNSQGLVPIHGREVGQRECQKVLEAAQAVPIPAHEQLLHVISQEFILDGQGGIQNPVGMKGVRLECKVHIVVGEVSKVQALIKCCNKAGVSVEDVVLQPLASAEAVLTPEERERGAVMVDFGGGTTDVAVFISGAIKHTASIPLGGVNLTSDLAIGLMTSMEEAERIKTTVGCCMPTMVGRRQTVAVRRADSPNPAQVSLQVVAEILGARTEELMRLVREQLEEAGLMQQLAGGVVITGGSAKLPGIVELAQQVFGLPTRRGLPRVEGNLEEVVAHPEFATALGLVMHGANSEELGEHILGEPKGILERMRRWFREIV